MEANTTASERLTGLANDEIFAAVAVERATGATAFAHDTNSRQGVHDVRLEYADGRVGALEITTHAGPGVRQSYSILGKDSWTWPNPGKWWWSAQVTDPRDIPKRRRCYQDVILMCEAEGRLRTSPDELDVAR